MPYLHLNVKDFPTKFSLKDKSSRNAELQSKIREITVFKNLGVYLRDSFIKGLWASQVSEQSAKTNNDISDDGWQDELFGQLFP